MIRRILRTLFPFVRRWRGVFHCEEAFPHFSEFIDRELDPRLLRRMEGHLDVCPACRKLLDSLERIKRVFQTDPDRPIPEETAQELLRGLRAEYEKARQQLGEIERG